MTAKSIAEAAYAYDETAREAYRTVASYLGRGLALIIDALNPEVIILAVFSASPRDLIEPYMLEVVHREAIGFFRCEVPDCAYRTG